VKGPWDTDQTQLIRFERSPKLLDEL